MGPLSMTRFFQTRFNHVRKPDEPDSARYSQTTLQAQASDDVARREYFQKHRPITINTQQEND